MPEPIADKDVPTEDEVFDLANALMSKGYTHRSRYEVARWVLELGYRRVTPPGTSP